MTSAQKMLADKIDYAISTEGKVTLFKDSGELVVAALRGDGRTERKAIDLIQTIARMERYDADVSDDKAEDAFGTVNSLISKAREIIALPSQPVQPAGTVALDTLEDAFVELTERFQKLPRPPTDRIDMLQYCIGAIRDVRSALPARPEAPAGVREALEFYAREWQRNGDGDPGTPGLSRAWMEPTDELNDDEGRKARKALASLPPQEAGSAKP